MSCIDVAYFMNVFKRKKHQTREKKREGNLTILAL